MKILMAIDGSGSSLRALDGLLQHVAWFRDPPAITLIHVHPPMPSGRAAAFLGKAAIDRYHDEESDEALAGARAILDAKALRYSVVKRVNDVGPEIASFAANGGFDLVAMGTRGHGALVNLVLGSVATKVLASSKVPVLLFP